jgi:sugar lactone lactonase YvrE
MTMNMKGMSLLRRTIALVSFCALTACGGASTMQTLPATPSATPPAKTSAHATKAQFTISVPPPSKTATANTRLPKYVSSSTQSVIITLTSVNNSPPPTGTPASIATNLTTSNPACSSTGGTLTCTVSAPVAVGNNVYSVVTYDAMQISSSPATPAGNVLSQATLPLTVTVNQVNTPTMPLVLNGVAASTTVTFASDPHIIASGQANAYTIVGNRPYTATITSQDADNNTIIGPGATTYTISSSSSAIMATTATANTATVQVKSFSTTPVTLAVTPSLSTPTAPQTNISLTTAQELWLAADNSGVVLGFAIIGSSPTQIPTDEIAPGGNFDPAGLAVDANGNIWVANDSFQGGSVSAYVPGTTTGPIETITSTIPGGGAFSPDALAVDASGTKLFIGDANNAVTAYSIISNTTHAQITPTQIAADSISTNISGPTGLAFDGSGNLWVVNNANQNVTAYTATAFSQNTADTIAGPLPNGFSSPRGVAIDSQGHVWVSDEELDNVTEWSVGSSAPSQILTLGGLTGAFGLAFDANGNLWVGIFNSVQEIVGGTTVIPLQQGVQTATGLAFTP